MPIEIIRAFFCKLDSAMSEREREREKGMNERREKGMKGGHPVKAVSLKNNRATFNRDY